MFCFFMFYMFLIAIKERTAKKILTNVKKSHVSTVELASTHMAATLVNVSVDLLAKTVKL